jgi:UDP-N-acetylmuramoylalanine--D-glutamate ligase
MPVSELSLKGAHNVENALAAVCAGMLMRCDPARIRQAVRNFKAVEHRLEYVATVRGVEYYNDSKATNVDATMKAAYTIGAAAEKIESQIRGATKIIHAETLENAIQKAASTARSGDVILLAPACSSFDQFENYEHRGQVFKQSVASLAQAELATAG